MQEHVREVPRIEVQIVEKEVEVIVEVEKEVGVAHEEVDRIQQQLRRVEAGGGASVALRGFQHFKGDFVE